MIRFFLSTLLLTSGYHLLASSKAPTRHEQKFEGNVRAQWPTEEFASDFIMRHMLDTVDDCQKMFNVKKYIKGDTTKFAFKLVGEYSLFYKSMWAIKMRNPGAQFYNLLGMAQGCLHELMHEHSQRHTRSPQQIQHLQNAEHQVNVLFEKYKDPAIEGVRCGILYGIHLPISERPFFYGTKLFYEEHIIKYLLALPSILIAEAQSDRIPKRHLALEGCLTKNMNSFIEAAEQHRLTPRHLLKEVNRLSIASTCEAILDLKLPLNEYLSSLSPEEFTFLVKNKLQWILKVLHTYSSYDLRANINRLKELEQKALSCASEFQQEIV